jgi:hypothetical protein
MAQRADPLQRPTGTAGFAEERQWTATVRAVQYGDSQSEKNLGRVLRNLKASNVVVGTKVRLPSAEFGHIADAVATSLVRVRHAFLG